MSSKASFIIWALFLGTALGAYACNLSPADKDPYHFADGPTRLSEITAPADYDWRAHQSVRALVHIDAARVAPHGGALLEVLEKNTGHLIYQGPINTHGQGQARFGVAHHVKQVRLTVKLGPQILDEATVDIGAEGTLTHHF